MSTFNDHVDNIKQHINTTWDQDIVPQLIEYIKIPNKSPMFDPGWEQNGFMKQAMDLIETWCQQQPIKDMVLEVIQHPGRTPLLFIDIPGQCDETVLLYGHMDKQPEMVGWDDNKGPWIPVIEDDKLYGRGGADDGYAAFSALTAIAALQKQGIPHSRCVVIIEACEESGSYDLPVYLEDLRPRIGEPDLIICLDSGAGNYEQLWSTTSLRGIAGGELKIKVLTEGIHSGLGSGIVPTCTMVLRQLLDRIENKETGEITLDELVVKVPELRVKQAEKTAAVLKDSIKKAYPFAGKTHAVASNTTELLLNRTWRARLSITGADGFPSIENAGNVTLPKLSVKISMRLAPTCDAEKATQVLKEALEKSPPFGADVSFIPEDCATGWHAPLLAEWLEIASDKASSAFFDTPAAYFGEGGSIPFMGMLGDLFPKAQFLITGVLGPKSNAHGPNEFLHIPMAKRVTGCVASVLASHFKHHQ